jgi:hypothetical protein
MKNTFKILLVILMTLMSINLAFGQDEEPTKKKTRTSLEYSQLANGTRALSAKIFTKEGPVFTYLENEEIEFVLRTDTLDIPLGKTQTNTSGIANFYIEKDFPIDTNEYGAYVFAFLYNGNDSCRAAEDEVEIKDLSIEFEFLEDEDGYRSVSIQLKDALGNGAAEQEVQVYVKRLYSLLPVGDDWSDDDGALEIEFPTDLPGDSLGTLHVVIKVLESDIYGTVIADERIAWGTPVDFTIQEDVRALWGQNTPWWMVIAISIVLIGAWSQFMIAIYHLIKMRKSA